MPLFPQVLHIFIYCDKPGQVVQSSQLEISALVLTVVSLLIEIKCQQKE